MLQLSKSRQHLASSILGEIQAGILSRAITVTFDHRMTGEWLTLRHQSMNFSLSARYNLQSVPATSLSVRWNEPPSTLTLTKSSVLSVSRVSHRAKHLLVSLLLKKFFFAKLSNLFLRIINNYKVIKFEVELTLKKEEEEEKGVLN